MGQRSKSRGTSHVRRAKTSAVVPLRNSQDHLASGIEARIHRIREAIQRQSTKSALEMAKQLHKEVHASQSEQVLVEAYNARIQDMNAKGMIQEAKALADLVVERFADAHAQETQRVLACQQGDLTALVSPLADPNLPIEQRLAIEQLLVCELADLKGLAECPGLSPDHDLRVAAQALWQAFTAVTTSSALDAGALDLHQVSRRSPLAQWKVLIRVLDALYQGDPAACRQILELLNPESAPARLVPVIQSLLEDRITQDLQPAARTLAARVLGERGRLNELMAQLDQALDARNQRQALALIRPVISCCRRVQPELEIPLKQHIMAKSCVAHFDPEPVISALKPMPANASFWRLFARAMEFKGNHGEACAIWDEFLRSAVQEGWFSAKGPEAAFLYLHMAESLSHHSSDDLEDLRDDFEYDPPCFDVFRDGLTPAVRVLNQDEDSHDKLYYIDPGQLFKQSCVLRPDADVYRLWSDWVKRDGQSSKQCEAVAERWARHFPKDPRPLLALAEWAEARQAYTKALRFITQAESLGSADPKVKRARWRLWVNKALAHLQARKPALVGKDLETLAALPQASEPNNVILLVTLRWAMAAQTEDASQCTNLADQLKGLIEVPGATDLMLISVVRVGCCPEAVEKKLRLNLEKRIASKQIGPAMACIWPIIKDLPLTLHVPILWQNPLEKLLKKKTTDLSPDQLQALADVTIAIEWEQAAYFCCGHGLRAGNPSLARFMFLRAKSLPDTLDERRMDCVSAASELARRQRDMDLVSEIVDWNRDEGVFSNPFGSGVMVDDLSLEEDDLQEILSLERKQIKYPKERWVKRSPLDDVFMDEGDDECDCPECRCRRQQEAASSLKPRKKVSRPRVEEPLLFDDLYDDPFDTPLDDPLPFDNLPANILGMPTEVAKLMLELVQANGGRPLKGDKDLDRVFKKRPDLIQEALEMVALYEGEPDVGFPSHSPGRRRKKPKRRK